MREDGMQRVGRHAEALPAVAVDEVGEGRGELQHRQDAERERAVESAHELSIERVHHHAALDHELVDRVLVPRRQRRRPRSSWFKPARAGRRGAPLLLTPLLRPLARFLYHRTRPRTHEALELHRGMAVHEEHADVVGDPVVVGVLHVEVVPRARRRRPRRARTARATRAARAAALLRQPPRAARAARVVACMPLAAARLPRATRQADTPDAVRRGPVLFARLVEPRRRDRRADAVLAVLAVLGDEGPPPDTPPAPLGELQQRGHLERISVLVELQQGGHPLLDERLLLGAQPPPPVARVQRRGRVVVVRRVGAQQVVEARVAEPHLLGAR